MCGSIADISTFSFYGNKTITTGEGGMVVTNHDSLAQKVRLLKGQGMDPNRRYWFTVIGYNYRMTNIQAAIGLGQLENIEQFLEKRRVISGWYNKHLKSIKGLVLPVEKKYASHSFWLYSVLIGIDSGQVRDEVMHFLANYGVETRPVFYPMHIMPTYKGYDSGNLRNAEFIASRGISLPMYFELTEKDVLFIADILRQQCQ